MARITALIHDFYFSAAVRENCQNTLGRYSAHTFLYEWDYHMELFCELSNDNFKCVYSKCEHFRKSLFSKNGAALVYNTLQHCSVLHSIRFAFSYDDLVSISWIFH